MWIDANRLRVDDFDPNEPGDEEGMTDEELAALEDLSAEEIAAMNAVEFESDEYPF